ncbi:MAG: DUF3299 domain-containing protein [Bdellovibrio sp.]
MDKSRIILVIGAFALSLAVGFFLFKNVGSGNLVDATEVDWKILADLDYITGNASDNLKSLDGKMVKVPGFMVPLEDEQKSVKTFLLVPSPQACIHVPPPPPNQMVLIEMDTSKEVKVEFGPIWVYGTLKLHSKRHLYGESSFQMVGVAIEPYR